MNSARPPVMLELAMHVDVSNTVVINRPVADVSRYAADPDNAPHWYANIKSVEWKTPRPATVGSRIDFVARLMMRAPGRQDLALLKRILEGKVR